jgi:hypothetical protein
MSKVCLFREKIGNEGVNWILQSQVRAVLKTGMKRIVSIKN